MLVLVVRFFFNFVCFINFLNQGGKSCIAFVFLMFPPPVMLGGLCRNSKPIESPWALPRPEDPKPTANHYRTTLATTDTPPNIAWFGVVWCLDWRAGVVGHESGVCMHVHDFMQNECNYGMGKDWLSFEPLELTSTLSTSTAPSF